MAPYIVDKENPSWEIRKYIWKSLEKDRQKILEGQAEEFRSVVSKRFCPLHPEAVQWIIISHEETFSGISAIVCCELFSSAIQLTLKRLSFEPDMYHIRNLIREN